MEQHVIVSICVAIARWTAFAPGAGGRFHGMSLQDPVADVDHMNILFEDDVSRKRAVVDPITQTLLERRAIGMLWAVEIAGQVMGFSANNCAQCAIVNAIGQLNKRRTIANLKSDVE